MIVRQSGCAWSNHTNAALATQMATGPSDCAASEYGGEREREGKRKVCIASFATYPLPSTKPT